MKPLPTSVPTEGVLRTFRHSPLNDWIGAIGISLPLVAGVWVLPKLGADLPGWMLLLAAPVAVLGGLLMLIVAAALWSAAFAARKPSNWLVKFMEEGAVLNLRSYKNAHFEPAADTLAAIPFAEIKSVGLLTEQVSTTHADRTSTRKARYVELTLQTDTGPLKAAVAAERNRCAPEKRGRLGGSSTLKHHHYPVQVTGPRTVRLEALPGLLDAFTERVLLAPERRADLDAELEGLAADERARAYLHRGHRLEAIHIGRNELGLSKRKAKDWIADLDGRDAA